MFALCAARQDGAGSEILPREVEAMAAALRGWATAPRVWHDERARGGAAAATAGILAEDEFDAQPLTSPELVFVAQGRVDNRDQILEALGMARGRWGTLADSAVLHAAYGRWGGDCVQRLHGDYAFAAWHRDSGDVVAAVDHLASSRLYYASEGLGRLLLSTQLGALLAHPLTPRTLNLTALGLLVAPKIEAGSTPFRQVKILAGGHMLTCRRGVIETKPWWRPDATVRTRYRDPRDYVAAAREVFDKAVAVRLRTGGEVAATMSGGLDSTLVSAAAAQQLSARGRNLTAYLSVPEPGIPCDNYAGWDADDSPWAAAVAGMHENLKLVKVTGGRCGTLALLPRIHAISRTPLRNGANHLWYANVFSSAAALGARVVLEGGKGNATVSQSVEGSLVELVRRMAWRALARELAGPGGRAALRRLRGLPLPSRRPGAALFIPAFLTARQGSLDTFAAPVSTRAGQVEFMKLGWHQWSADARAQWGVETRDPTGDRRLIELLLSFPPEAFSIARWPRGLARAMGEGRIPDAVRFRPTRGMQMPEIAGLVALNARQYREAIDRAEGSAQFRSIFDVERVRALLEGVCDGRATGEADILDRVADVGMFIAGAGR